MGLLDEFAQEIYWSCGAGRATFHRLSDAARGTALAKKLYIGNIPFTTTEDELRSMFEEHGAVASVNVITDRETGRARGFAFVEMNEAGEADNAMRALDGKGGPL